MKITIAQLNPTVADFAGNLQKIRNTLRDNSAELIIFSELFLSGYPPRDLLKKTDFIKQNQQALSELLVISRQFDQKLILVGCIFLQNNRLYNSALIIQNGQILFRQDKSLLACHDFFDETHYFQAADKVEIFTYKNMKLAVLISQDCYPLDWKYFYNRYHQSPLTILKQADLLINLSAIPFDISKTYDKNRSLQEIALNYQLPVINVNQSGGNDELLFEGSSLVINRYGQIISKAAGFREDRLTFTEDIFSTDGQEITDDKIADIQAALVMGIKDYFAKSGFQKAILGLSGGIDSAVVAALAVEALGADNVSGITMPSMHSSAGSYLDSQTLADNLGITMKTITIKELYNGYLEKLKVFFQGKQENIAEENIQSRIRGNLLMFFSNKLGDLVLITGNKSEAAMGYCTLYGDMSGGLSVISDLYKTTVYQLANRINQNRIIIPQEIIDKEPSAELRPNQKDSDSLPDYQILDGILKLYLEKNLSIEQIIELGYQKQVVTKIIHRLQINEYKRKQFPLGLKISINGFETGSRYPLARKY